MQTESQYFSAAATEEATALSQTFGALYSRLSNEAYALGNRLWKYQPKFHLFQHLAEYLLAFQGNPRFSWTYQDEDLVGEVIEVSHSVHCNSLAPAVLLKWVHFVFAAADKP